MPASTSPVIDAEFVATWSPQYEISEVEDRIMSSDGPKAKKKGELKKKAFLRIAEWKAVANLATFQAMDKDEISFVTEVALDKDTPDVYKLRFLQAIKGVGVPLASALLAAVHPKKFIIMDARAVGTLHAAGLLESNNPARVDYIEYRDVCRQLAAGAKCSLLDLYRALYAYADGHSQR